MRFFMGGLPVHDRTAKFRDLQPSSLNQRCWRLTFLVTCREGPRTFACSALLSDRRLIFALRPETVLKVQPYWHSESVSLPSYRHPIYGGTAMRPAPIRCALRRPFMPGLSGHQRLRILTSIQRDTYYSWCILTTCQTVPVYYATPCLNISVVWELDKNMNDQIAKYPAAMIHIHNSCCLIRKPPSSDKQHANQCESPPNKKIKKQKYSVHVDAAPLTQITRYDASCRSVFLFGIARREHAREAGALVASNVPLAVLLVQDNDVSSLVRK